MLIDKIDYHKKMQLHYSELPSKNQVSQAICKHYYVYHSQQLCNLLDAAVLQLVDELNINQGVKITTTI
jgi:hypothetical protein